MAKNTPKKTTPTKTTAKKGPERKRPKPPKKDPAPALKSGKGLSTARKAGLGRNPAGKKASKAVVAPETERGAAEKPGRSKRKSSIKASVLARIRVQLADKKRAVLSHLESELSELEKPEKRHRADLEEMASDTHDADSLCEIMDIEASQIDQIDLALAKIDNGTYGICEDCGGDIPIVRLEALPFATQCIDCKRKAELEGQLTSPAPPAARS
jgi:DnaK suppressor protein